LLRVNELENQGSVAGGVFMSLSHWSMDTYQNILPVLGPMLMPLFGLSFTQVGLITTVFLITSSVLQPVLGHFSDRGPGKWLMVVGLAWTAVIMGFSGWAPNYLILLVLVTVAGLGSAAFHPQASAVVWSFGGRRRGTIMSIFALGGNLGFAVGPAVTAAILLRTGLRGTLWLTIPGVIMALALFVAIPGRSLAQPKHTAEQSVAARKPARLGLVFLCLVVAFRSWTSLGLITFLPLYFVAQKISLADSSLIVTAFLIVGALGGLLGAYISDLTDRRLVTILSMAAAGPILLAFLATAGPAALVLLLVGYFALMAGFSVNITMGQEMLPGREATAGGLLLGFAFGVGGIAVMATGAISDHFGLTTAMVVMAALPILAAVSGLFIPPVRKKAVEVGLVA
jgi:MFS transporter, FSR family, fosmidomycin resistance protein